jgi:hypothetical protein
LSSRQRSKFIHLFLDNLRALIIKRIHGFPGLEKHIRVLGRAAQYRMIRREGLQVGQSTAIFAQYPVRS